MRLVSPLGQLHEWIPLSVAAARNHDHTWDAIGRQLGVTATTARRRHRSHFSAAPGAGPSPRRVQVSPTRRWRPRLRLLRPPPPSRPPRLRSPTARSGGSPTRRSSSNTFRAHDAALRDLACLPGALRGSAAFWDQRHLHRRRAGALRRRREGTEALTRSAGVPHNVDATGTPAPLDRGRVARDDDDDVAVPDGTTVPMVPIPRR